MRRWSLLLVGLLLGLGMGLVYTWVIAPPEYYDTYPPLLYRPYREDWIRMTALAHGAEGRWPRTRLRLRGLPEAEVRQTLAEVLDTAVATGRPMPVLYRIAELADAYGVDSAAVRIYARQATPGATLVAASPTAPRSTPTATPTPQPTTTPSPTPTPPAPAPSAYRVISQTLTCAEAPHLSVSLVASGTLEGRGRNREVVFEPLPGREVWLLWEDGADRAVTGFKPAFDLGYVDFQIEPGHVYRLYVETPVGAPVTTVQVAPCAPEEGEGWIARWLQVMAPPPPTPSPTPTPPATPTASPTPEE